MNLNEWLRSPEGRLLCISEDSREYPLLKRIWEVAQENVPKPVIKKKKTGKKAVKNA